MTSVIRTWIGQGTLVHTVPVASGQLFLVGHMSLSLFYASRGRKPRHQTASEIIYESAAPAHKCKESLQSIFTSPPALENKIAEWTVHNHTAQSYRKHTCMCSPSTPTHNEPLCHLGFTPPLPLSPIPFLPSRPHAYWAHPRCLLCPFSHSAHPRPHTLSPSERRQAFSRFLLLLSTPTHSKRLWITGWHADAPARLLCFRWSGTNISFFFFFLPWLVKHSPLWWGLTCT